MSGRASVHCLYGPRRASLRDCHGVTIVTAGYSPQKRKVTVSRVHELDLSRGHCWVVALEGGSVKLNVCRGRRAGIPVTSPTLSLQVPPRICSPS